MNPMLGGEKRPASGKRGPIQGNYKADKNSQQHNLMQEQSPNKMINQSQGSNMHHVADTINKKRASHQPENKKESRQHQRENDHPPQPTTSLKHHSDH